MRGIILKNVNTSLADNVPIKHPYVVILFIIAFLLRLLIALTIQTPIISDDSDYHEIGKAVAEGRGFSNLDHLTAIRTPGYPIFLSICYRLCGPSIIAVRCFQAFIDTITCLLLFLIGRSLFNERIAFIAFGTLAIFPLHLVYIPRLLSEILFTMFLLLYIWLMIRKWEKYHMLLQIFLGGITLGIATLVRPTAGILLCVGFWFIWNQYIPRKEKALNTAVFIAAFTIILLPWLMRNQIVFGHFALTSTTGTNLWIGNNSSANGGYSFHDDAKFLFKNEDEFENSKKGFSLVKQYITSHPWVYPLLEAKKLAHLFSTDFGAMIFLEYQCHPEWNQHPITVKMFKELSFPLWLGLHIPYIVIVILGIIGILYHSQKGNLGIQMLLLIIISLVIVHLIFFGGARFRMPIMPIMILFAANEWNEWRAGRVSFYNKKGATAAGLTFLIFTIFLAEYLTLLARN